MLSGLAPGVHVAPPPPAPRTEGVRIDVAGFVGIAAKGLVGKAIALEGWPQFVARFGEFLPNAFLAYAVRAFFDNGGRRCWVVRAGAPELKTISVMPWPAPGDGSAIDVANAAGLRAGAVATLSQSGSTMSTGAQPADRLSSLTVNAHGFYPGARVKILQAPKPPVFARVRSIDIAANRIDWDSPLPADLNLALPFRLETRLTDRALIAGVAGNRISWAHPIDARFDPALPIDIAAGLGTAEAELLDESGLPLLLISASSPGQWGDKIAVRVTTRLSAETRSRRRDAPDAPKLLSLEQVVGLTEGSTVTIDQAGIPTARRVLVRIDAPTLQVELDSPLAGFDLAAAADGTKPIVLRRLSFSLGVSIAGRLSETFVDLDLPPGSAPDSSSVNRSSSTIRLRRVGGLAAGDYPFPDPASGAFEFGQVSLEGGRDGIAMLRPQDLTGRADAAERIGLRQFELIDEPAGLAVPDAVIPPLPAVERAPLAPPPAPDPCDLCAPPQLAKAPAPPPPIVESTPALSRDDVAAIQAAFVEHCEGRGDRVALIDPPLQLDKPDRWDLDALTAWRQGFESSYAAAYFPWATVVDPIVVPPTATRDVPVSGHALGQFSLADAEDRRPTPANRPVQWVSALPRSLEDAEHAGLNSTGINCVRVSPGRGVRVMGARTLSSRADLAQLTVRRTLIRLKRMLSRSLQWTVFEPNGDALLDLAIAQIEGFLESEWEAQRLTGATADEAFYVRPLTTADDFDNGRFVLEIGIAPSVPAEFVILRLSRSEDRLDLAELSGEGGWPT